MHRLRLLPLAVVPLFLVACLQNDGYSLSGGNSNNYSQNPVTPVPGEISLAAGLTEISPSPTDSLTGAFNLSRLGLTGFSRTYELTTPANTDFAFSIVARSRGNSGTVNISAAHVADGAATPSGGVESIAASGISLQSPALTNLGNFVQATGDGFARVGLSGRIAQTQVLAFKVSLNNTMETLGVRVRIAGLSIINTGNTVQNARPGMTSSDIFSSESYLFGLPSIAVSGDRYTLVTYDGDANYNRRRQWLQVSASSGAVTGDAGDCPALDTGFWRDQEIAALGNVIAIAFTGDGQVRMDVSLDRGASFPILAVLDSGSGWSWRLVQAAISSDYTIGCLFWRTVEVNGQPSGQWVLVEGTPTAFDTNNTPTGYAWSWPTVVRNTGADTTPIVSHLQYSTGGDLVIGYGYTHSVVSGTTRTNTANFRCAVRRFGQSAFSDVLVDTETNIVPTDPHVAVIGSGVNMMILYAYERTGGIYLGFSNNAGASFTTSPIVAEAGAATPSIFARMQGTQLRVDLLFVTPVSAGLELHDMLWTDFSPGNYPTRYRLTQVRNVQGATPPPGLPYYDATVSLAYFGYDAELKGDDLAVVVHEVKYQPYEIYWGGFVGAPVPPPAAPGAPVFFSTPPPTVLLPGLTGAVAAPDANHAQQLRLLVID